MSNNWRFRFQFTIQHNLVTIIIHRKKYYKILIYYTIWLLARLRIFKIRLPVCFTNTMANDCLVNIRFILTRGWTPFHVSHSRWNTLSLTFLQFLQIEALLSTWAKTWVYLQRLVAANYLPVIVTNSSLILSDFIFPTPGVLASIKEKIWVFYSVECWIKLRRKWWRYHIMFGARKLEGS